LSQHISLNDVCTQRRIDVYHMQDVHDANIANSDGEPFSSENPTRDFNPEIRLRKDGCSSTKGTLVVTRQAVEEEFLEKEYRLDNK